MMKTSTQKKVKLTWSIIISTIMNIGIIGLCVYLETLLSSAGSVEDILFSKTSDSGNVSSTIFQIDTYLKYFNLVAVLSFRDISASCLYLFGYGLNIFVLYALCISELIKILKSKKTYEVDNKYGSHGDAEWAKEDDMNRIYKGNSKLGWFLGSDSETEFKFEEAITNENYLVHTTDNEEDLNMQMMVFGPPGSKKTISTVLPSLLLIPKAYREKGLQLPDIICTDPKAELLEKTYKYYSEDYGYDVKVLDYKDLKIGDTLNNLYYINKERDLWTFASNYVEALAGKEGGKDKYWIDQATTLLAAITGFNLQKYPIEKQNMVGLLEILQSENVRDFELAKDFFVNAGLQGAALYCWNNFLSAGNSPETYSSIISTLSKDLTLYSFADVQNQSQNNTCNIKLLGKKIAEKDEIERLSESYKLDTEKNTQKMLKAVERLQNRANQVIDYFEKFNDIEIVNRKDYELIIKDLGKQLDDEEFNLMTEDVTLSNSEDKKDKKKRENVQKRLEEMHNAFRGIRSFYIRKSRVNKLTEKYRKRIESNQKELDNIKRKPMIVFILISDSDKSLHPLVNVATNTMLRQLYTNAEPTRGVLETPVYFIFEEFCNIGRINGIEEKLGTMRSKRIYPMLIIQSLSQLKARYKDEWEDIYSQCDTKVVLRCNDNFTAEYISKTLGSQTIRVQGSQDSHLTAMTEGYSLLTEQFQAKKLLEIDQLQRIHKDKMIVIASGLRPMFLNKVTFNHWQNGWKDNMEIDINTLNKI